ncbi:Di-copper centre-containing protein [Xylariaceae sp. FL1019]|nr:Di-copper centre-containing protein [Xylariaceae sp. FL1019]
MLFSSLASAALLGAAVVAPVSGSPTRRAADNDLQALLDLNQQAVDALNQTTPSEKRSSCDFSNAPRRRDWEYLSSSEKKEYIGAVKCLQAKPSKADPSFAPGAKTRYDDFVAVHINQTLSIHGTGNFLTWHRYFTYAYEQALRNECDYTGYQPYWNWLSHRCDPRNSPLFDGSDTSFSGDGSFVQHNGSVNGNGYVYIPSGQGGGCVTSGPFVNYTINLGPVLPIQDGMAASPTLLGYNPHCMARDLSAFTASNWLTLTNILNITIGAASDSVYDFQNELQGRFTDGFLGLHTAGHGVMGGTSGDLYGSPVDPVFFLHHAMVDRTYWIWQALHPAKADTLGGTITLFNTPPSRDTSVEDWLYMGSLIDDIQIKDVLNTLSGGPLCYTYV